MLVFSMDLVVKYGSENDENPIKLNVDSKMGYPHFPKGNVDFFEFSHLTKFSLRTEISSQIDENSIISNVDSKMGTPILRRGMLDFSNFFI